MFGKFNFLKIHIWVSILKIYGFCDDFGMGAATFLCICGSKKWSREYSEAALIF